eukprot:c28820_g2_i5 orf=214-2778(+)
MDFHPATPGCQTGGCKDDKIAQLLDMGFEMSAVLQAVEIVADESVAEAVEFLLGDNRKRLSRDAEVLEKGRPWCDSDSLSLGVVAQVNTRCFVSKCEKEAELVVTDAVTRAGNETQGAECGDIVGHATLELLKRQRKYLPWLSKNHKEDALATPHKLPAHSRRLCSESHCASDRQYGKNNFNVKGTALGSDLERQAQATVQRYFGYGKLKDFQLEALKAWAAQQDCFVLAATGSGKSLCFQLPALMTGKVVVVVSPLISLMHDQCLRLASHDISACFLGSGQTDRTVENGAMTGAYDIVYVCPETLTRLVGSIQKLAQGRGITLFAIDEAHCISKWGHDFRPEYRRLSVLREKFKAHAIDGLRHDIPIMLLTATATQRVQEDILNSIGIDKTSAKIVLTSLFRPNLRFSVRHSKTRRQQSYEADFKDLISIYTKDRGIQQKIDNGSQFKISFKYDIEGLQTSQKGFTGHKDVNATDSGYGSDDACGESAMIDSGSESSLGCLDISDEKEDEPVQDEDLEGLDETARSDAFGGDGINEIGPSSILSQKIYDSDAGGGPTIVYLPTRMETERLAEFLTKSGVKAAAYHAKMPKRQLRLVHEKFHNGSLQVVVATIAFGMGIDKANVRRIIHYGWPQSLEAYYQEAGRAGRDGLFSECTLFCDMTVLPSLLPNRRDPEQTENALLMLEHCFRYGLSTKKCRVDMLLSYFGEDIVDHRCNICDFCTMGLPSLENLTKEAQSLLSILTESKGGCTSEIRSQKQAGGCKRRHKIRPNEDLSFRLAVQMLNEEIAGRNRLWWRGFGRILMDSGYLKETGNLIGSSRTKGIVCSLKYPEVTIRGMTFLKNCNAMPSSIADLC